MVIGSVSSAARRDVPEVPSRKRARRIARRRRHGARKEKKEEAMFVAVSYSIMDWLVAAYRVYK
jgi:hypothetical protein